MRKRFARVKELASSIGVHPNTVYRWAQRGHVEARRLGTSSGGWLIRLDEEGLPIAVEPSGPPDPEEK
jgi:excisionase family DNA binding protein